MSLGLRVTIEEILRDVSFLREEEMRTRGGGGIIPDADFDDDDDDDDCKGGQTTMIDLALAIRILMRQVRGWDGEDEEARAYFGLFDGGGKGYVTLDDLRRVRDEVGEAEREMLSGAVGDGDAGAVVVGDAALRRMIEQFDDDRDGVVDYREFGNLLSPLFPSPDLVD
jgi:Ca2+-binding EF-hand superfamily protein